MGKLTLVKGGQNVGIERKQSAMVPREALLQKIYEAGVALGAIEDVASLLNKVCEIGLAVAQCDSVALFSVEHGALKFQTCLSYSYPSENEATSFYKGFLLPTDSSTLAGHCVATKKILSVNDLAFHSSEGEFGHGYIMERLPYAYKSVLVLPILDPQQNVLGVLEFANHIGASGAFDAFPSGLHEYLRVLATQVGTVLKNVKAAQDLKRSWTETVLRFVRASESRDPETGGHVERIGLYSSMMYEKLGYGPEACECIRMAAMLHDIGKLAVPDAILKKPGKLTADEWKVMQTHAMAGYRLLANSESPMLQMGAVVACTHHEKWNGSGYPQGLAGEDIPLVGRIVALVDVFDALSSKRCYKEAWPVEKVLETIEQDTGSHFDPQLVDLFKENLVTALQIFHDFSNDRFLPTPDSELHDQETDFHEEFKPDLSLPKVS